MSWEWVGGDPKNWTAPKHQSTDPKNTQVFIPERVCQACRQNECVSCMGAPYGREMERREEATARLGPGCLCAEQGHPTPVTCGEDVWKSEGNWASHHRCSKPVKGSAMIQRTWGSGLPLGDYEAHRCGLHLSMYRRRVERAEAEAAEREQREEANERAKAEGRAADETATMLNEACDMLGIPIKAVAKGGYRYAGVVPAPIAIEIDHEAAGALARFLIERHG